MPSVVFTLAAEADIVDAVDWYESRSQGLGARFVAALGAAVARVADNPLQFPDVHKGVRRVLLRRFPYALFFRIRDDDAQVLACFHTSQDPRRWRERT